MMYSGYFNIYDSLIIFFSFEFIYQMTCADELKIVKKPYSAGVKMIGTSPQGSYPRMKISPTNERLTLLRDYIEHYDRFISVTLKLDDFPEIASQKGYDVAEAGLSIISDAISLNLPTSLTVLRVDISTLFIVSASNIVDSREVMESRVKRAINIAMKGGRIARKSFAIFPDDCRNAEHLLVRMDALMPAQWEEANDTQVGSGVNFINEIKKGNIISYAQAVYKPSGKLRSVELLSRWKHEEIGIVPPSEFLEGIRTQGGTNELLKVLLNSAVSLQSKATSIHGGKLIVSLNINPLDLLDSRIRETLERFSNSNDVSFIELELIETDDFGEIKGFPDVIELINNYGYRIAIDDFGSKYAWINSLGDYVNTIKLDRMLTQRISKGSNTSKANMVVESIIKMAKKLEVDVIAEGVEDEQDYIQMSEKGVSGLQGYFLAAPCCIEYFLNNIVWEKDMGFSPMAYNDEVNLTKH